MRDGGSGYFESNFNQLANSRAQHKDFVMKYPSLDLLKNAINELDDVNLKGAMQSIVSELEFGKTNKFNF